MAKNNSFTIHAITRTGKLSYHFREFTKMILLVLCAFLSFSCRHANDSEPSTSSVVTFAVDIFSVDRDSTFSVSRRATPADISLNQAGMTDLWVFEGTTLLAHQHTGDANYGTPEVELSYGEHYITFVASSQSGQQFTAGVWSADKANDCFGSVEVVDVTSATSAHAVILQRCTYGLKWQSTDLVPAGVSTLRLKVSPMRESLTELLVATNGYERTYVYDVSGYIGRTISVTVFGLPEMFGIEDQVTSTIEFLSATESVLYSHTRTIPVLTNRRTIITGPLFNGSASAAIRINSNWLTDYETSL